MTFTVVNSNYRVHLSNINLTLERAIDVQCFLYCMLARLIHYEDFLHYFITVEFYFSSNHNCHKDIFIDALLSINVSH